MKNLAGNKQADNFIIPELEAAGIPTVNVDRVDREVAYSVIGKLVTKGGKEITFKRAWYYWMVSGPIPLDIAKILYSTELGQRDVRVAGHCGCPPPEEWAMPDWTQLTEEQRKKFSGMNYGQIADLLNSGKLKMDRFVDSYHIDSQEGLNWFVQVLREQGLV